MTLYKILFKMSRRSKMEKRKNHTSTEVKRKYNEKTYGRIEVKERKEIVVAFKAKCEAEGISQQQVLKEAIHDFLEQ